MKRTVLMIFVVLMFVMAIVGCENKPTTSDDIQKSQQEQMLKEASAQTGMPAIKNFRERKMAKDILELRDQEGLVTYTYLWNEFNGKKVFFCESVGYGLPYATQYSNPQKIEASQHQTGYAILPQADPNGLFSPASAEGTWVLCKDPNGKKVAPVYVEPRIIVSPFKLD
jgi:hypothetical protein